MDLSPQGFRAEVGPHPVASGGAFSLKMGNLEALGAALRWTRDTSAGFAFDRPIHPAVLDHIVRVHPPSDPQA
ncbi:hypothetical protein [Tsuneonella sp. SYSU-LHT278]|uniref:hypothetical protein n=1 Tax=Tsuneonella sediminis TaxID=3416089 RepID=UPI003F7A40B9